MIIVENYTQGLFFDYLIRLFENFIKIMLTKIQLKQKRSKVKHVTNLLTI